MLKNVNALACCLIIGVLQMVCPFAQAADINGSFGLRINTPCGEYVESLAGPSNVGQRAANRYYILGWIDAYNMQTPDTFDIAKGQNTAAVELWLEKYCRENPFNNLTQALLAMVKELYPTRYRKQLN